MFGSGVRIGTAVIALIHRLILQVQAVVLLASCVVVAGAAMRGTVAYLFVTSSILTTGTTTTASV